ncbi:MAG: hypothetical protein V2A65_01425 [Candidatus Omnitrophota bacterium]
MEKIQEIVERVLKRKASPPEENDYLALWEDQVPVEIRRHTKVRVSKNELIAYVDNPTTKHLLFLQKEQIINAFRKSNFPIKGIEIKNQKGEKHVSGYARCAGNPIQKGEGRRKTFWGPD